MSEYECVACGDTGRNSNGGLCGPCDAHGRQPVRDAILAGMLDIFAEYHKSDRRPPMSELQNLVKWAYAPRVLYAAGYKEKGSPEAGMFAGPTASIDEIFEVVPLEDRPAYIIKLIRAKCFGGEVQHEPIAKWMGGKWRNKRKSR